MAYGITALVEAGVPRSLFDVPAAFREDHNGQLHAQDPRVQNEFGCTMGGTHVTPPLNRVRSADLCVCARGRRPLALDGFDPFELAEQIVAAGQLVHRAETGLAVPLRLRALLLARELEDQAGSGTGEQVEELITARTGALTRTLRHPIELTGTQQRAWRQLAGHLLARGRSHTPPATLPAELGLLPDPPAAFDLEEDASTAVLRTLSAGFDWDDAAADALTAIRSKAGPSGLRATPEAGQALGAHTRDLLAHWRGEVEHEQAAHPGPDVIVACPDISPLDGFPYTRMARLLAPAQLFTGGYAVVAVVPPVVAAALYMVTRHYVPVSLVAPAEAGDTEQVLAALASILAGNNPPVVGDALGAARAIAAPAQA